LVDFRRKSELRRSSITKWHAQVLTAIMSQGYMALAPYLRKIN